MVSVILDSNLVTFAVVDSYAKVRYKEQYASLPAPSNVVIDIIPDEEFQPDANCWHAVMCDQRVRLGQLTKPRGASRTISTSTVYASVSSDSKLSSSRVARVYYSTRDEFLTTGDWSLMQWTQPFEGIYTAMEGLAESGRRLYLRVLTLYYMMANAHLDKICTSRAAFHTHLETACNYVSAMNGTPQAPRRGGTSTVPWHSSRLYLENIRVPRPRIVLNEDRRNIDLRQSKTQDDRRAVRTQKRPREDEDEASSPTTVRHGSNTSSSVRETTNTDHRASVNNNTRVLVRLSGVFSGSCPD
jgi:hypothetical protein